VAKINLFPQVHYSSRIASAEEAKADILLTTDAEVLNDSFIMQKSD
jgi:hypothetical protein